MGHIWKCRKLSRFLNNPFLAIGSAPRTVVHYRSKLVGVSCIDPVDAHLGELGVDFSILKKDLDVLAAIWTRLLMLKQTLPYWFPVNPPVPMNLNFDTLILKASSANWQRIKKRTSWYRQNHNRPNRCNIIKGYYSRWITAGDTDFLKILFFLNRKT